VIISSYFHVHTRIVNKIVHEVGKIIGAFFVVMVVAIKAAIIFMNHFYVAIPEKLNDSIPLDS